MIRRWKKKVGSRERTTLRERLERRTKQEEIDSGEEKADDAEDDKGSIFCLLYYTGMPRQIGTGSEQFLHNQF